MQTHKILWKEVLSISITSFILSYILFLMIQVIMADILKDYIIPLYENKKGYTMILIILLSGIFIHLGINYVLLLIFIDIYNKFTLFYILFVSFILTLIFLFFMSYIIIYGMYPEIFERYDILQTLLLMPSFMIYFSIYALESPVLLWEISSIIYSIFSTILIKQFIEVKYKSKKKIKPLYRSIL